MDKKMPDSVGRMLLYVGRIRGLLFSHCLRNIVYEQEWGGLLFFPGIIFGLFCKRIFFDLQSSNKLLFIERLRRFVCGIPALSPHPPLFDK